MTVQSFGGMMVMKVLKRTVKERKMEYMALFVLGVAYGIWIELYVDMVRYYARVKARK